MIYRIALASSFPLFLRHLEALNDRAKTPQQGDEIVAAKLSFAQSTKALVPIINEVTNFHKLPSAYQKRLIIACFDAFASNAYYQLSDEPRRDEQYQAMMNMITMSYLTLCAMLERSSTVNIELDSPLLIFREQPQFNRTKGIVGQLVVTRRQASEQYLIHSASANNGASQGCGVFLYAALGLPFPSGIPMPPSHRASSSAYRLPTRKKRLDATRFGQLKEELRSGKFDLCITCGSWQSTTEKQSAAERYKLCSACSLGM